MKLSQLICILILFLFLLGCKAKMDVEVEKSNPLEGTTWEAISLKVTGDTIITLPQSSYERTILLYGKTHYAVVSQDTSLKDSHYEVGTYICKGDSLTYTLLIFPYYEDIGKSFKNNFQIEGNKLVVTGENLHYYGKDWKTYREEWKRID